ncbi:GumC family protein [Paucibacter sp. XJ19-41]|uniref:GumC family protein n=1 Tax=Paucibacter sp. XJ19-41 TaxID=2927824 RepID=UPI00234BC191|nr:Wzz/FepE/Etk N-terminal domain-containing protein [Paucibacter sp. XJ19-41]MDC6166179.1 Wzz/FepE/Etk N-terminal domain-containing protein [Paucibacter sp. XJ19-41]
MIQSTTTQARPDANTSHEAEDGLALLDTLAILAVHWRLLTAVPFIVSALALGTTYLIAPTFTARTTFLPPQQQQNSAASVLASLGALSGLAGGVGGIKSPGDQYVALLQSDNIEDRIIDRFKLIEVYESKYRFEARATLEKNVRISLGKKDGLIAVEADANDPQLAADIANAHVSELRRLSSELALTEAQQRRAFFEVELTRTKTKLTEAQQALQGSGFNAGALKAEPKAAAEGYASLKAQATAAEVRLQTLRRGMTDTAPEVQQQLALLGSLRHQLARLEVSSNTENDADYISRYREFKYQEALFDLFAKQFEMARLDESREGAVIQVVDRASVPEYKSKPKRAYIAIAAGLASLVLSIAWIFGRDFVQRLRSTINENKLSTCAPNTPPNA